MPRTSSGGVAEPLIADELRALVERAQGADPTGLPELRDLLEDHTEVWSHARLLAMVVERVWHDLLEAEGPGAVKAMNERLAEMRAKLTRPNATYAEQMLVDRVASNWILICILQRLSNDPDRSVLGQEAGRRLEHSHRQHDRALIDLKTFQRLVQPDAGSETRVWLPGDQRSKSCNG
jgi:hypothetical protein